MADENSGGSLELAKAYVQIVPSMRGVRDALRDEFGDSGDDSGKFFGSGFVKAALAAVSAAKVGEAIKDSFLEGAKLEQSIGGVETLFKDSAQAVIANAETAYKRAGVSANTYMEQATSFSASLLQSLGGDTVKAAEMADLAIVDMSDNANKFGSDIASIQNAYQGFAKQNYTMLDNLKLGYGGTKAEMERLLADAEKLSDTPIDLDISNLSDVYKAIHIVQESLDITGTTSKEAATTFSGSFASMEAAADNLLGALTTGGNIDEAVQGLADTSLTFADNVLRMTKTMLNELPAVGRGLSENLLQKLGASDEAAEELTTAIKDTAIVTGVLFATVKLESMLAATSLGGVTLSVGGLTAAAVNAELALKSAFAVMKTNAPLLALAAVATAATVVSNKIDKMTDSIDAAYDPAEHLGEKFTAISKAASEAAESVADISGGFHGELDKIESETAGYAAMAARLKELNRVQERTAAEQSEFESIITELNKKYPKLNLKIDENTGLLRSQERAIDAVVDAAERQAKADEAQNDLSKLYAAQDAALKAYNTALENRNALIAAGTDMYSDSAAAINIAYVTASDALRNINADIAEANAVIAENDAAQTVEEISKAVQEHAGIVEQVKNDLKDYAVEIGENTINISQDTYDAIQGIADKYTELVQVQEDTIGGSLDLFSDFGEISTISFGELDSNLVSNRQALQEWADGIKKLEDAGISEGLLDELKSMGTNSLAEVRALASATPAELQHYSDAYDYTYSEIHRIAEEQLEKIYEDSAKQIQKLISQPGKYTADLEDAYAVFAEYAPEGYAKGMASEEKTAEIKKVTAQMVSKSITEAKATLDAHSPSKEFEKLGEYAGEGFAQGMENADILTDIGTAAHNMAMRAINTVMETLDAHSPSKVFEKIGTYIPQGMAEGIEKDSDAAYIAAAEMANGTIDATSIYGAYLYDRSDEIARMVSAGDAAPPSVTPGGGTLHDKEKKPVAVQIYVSGRQMAEWLFDDIDDLLGQKLRIAGRGLG